MQFESIYHSRFSLTEDAAFCILAGTKAFGRRDFPRVLALFIKTIGGRRNDKTIRFSACESKKALAARDFVVNSNQRRVYPVNTDASANAAEPNQPNCFEPTDPAGVRMDRLIPI